MLERPETLAIGFTEMPGSARISRPVQNMRNYQKILQILISKVHFSTDFLSESHSVKPNSALRYWGPRSITPNFLFCLSKVPRQTEKVFLKSAWVTKLEIGKRSSPLCVASNLSHISHYGSNRRARPTARPPGLLWKPLHARGASHPMARPRRSPLS